MSDPVPGSFRDPSGFLFRHEGLLYRQINASYKDNYDHLMQSGLYQSLVDSHLLIPHEEVEVAAVKFDRLYKIIQPEPIPFISYPYEWCFSQLKDAALTTLSIQKRALQFGMSLKDCSAYNIQFWNGRPVLIDTLSFEKYKEGVPWVAYRQFCQHFLAPLALMSCKDIRLNQLLRIYLDGIPLDLASSLLPPWAYRRAALLFHMYFHAKSQKHYAKMPAKKNPIQGQFNIKSLYGLIDSLENSVKKLTWQPPRSVWRDYYTEGDSYSPGALEQKKQIVTALLDLLRPKMVWDLGANTGVFSRIAAGKGSQTIAFDADPACVELNYRASSASDDHHILSLMLDLTNPSPQIGWENKERMSLFERGPADTVLALALIHHLVISNNLPLRLAAEFFQKICHSLIIEFVPKSDPKVQELLFHRDDVFADYTQQIFEDEFCRFFTIQQCREIQDSPRLLYFMKKK